MVEDGVDGMVGELIFQPRKPVVAIDPQFFDFALEKLDRIIAMTHWYPVLGVHEV